MTSARRKLQGVRQQVANNLLQFIGISPCHQLIFHAKAVQRQTLLLGIKLKRIADVVHGFHHINLLHTKTQGIVLQFVEVHQLVYQFEHTLNAALSDVKQVALFAAYRAALG